MSRLRCPLRTPEGLLGKAAVGGANTGADCLVFIGRGLALGAVNKLLGFAGDASVMFDVQMTAQTQARRGAEAPLADKVAWGSRRKWNFLRKRGWRIDEGLT